MGSRHKLGTRSGLTLISALAFTLIVGTVLAGVGTLAVSHYSRSEVEGTYANAVSLAEAGINYEIAWISFDVTDTGRAHQRNAPYTGSVSGSDGTFQVYVEDYNTGGTWVPPNDLRLVGTGVIGGISRKVEVRGIRKSIFDEYAIYAIEQGTFSGGGQGAGSTEIVGNMGTNGDTTFNGTLNTDIVNGELHLNGGDASSSDGDEPNLADNVVKNPDPVIFPTVTMVANAAFSGGLQWLAANNANSQIKRFSSTNTSVADEPTIAGFTMADVNSKLVSAGFTTASRVLTDPPNSVPSASSNLDAANGTRFRYGGDLTYGTPAEGIQSKRTYFLPPGDYYFHKIDYRAGNAAMVLLTHLGRVRIWIDEGNNGADYMSSIFIFTDPDPSKFRLYYNKCGTLNISGSSRFAGGFYAVKDGCQTSTPYIDFAGNSMVYGSVITEYFRVTGGSKLVFPNNGGGASDDDFPLWYGFKDKWRELNLNGNPVFVDGTSD